MKRKIYLAKVGLLLVCLTITGTLSFVWHEDQSFSETENRLLMQKPAFLFSDFIKKEYQDKTETYLKDQFPNRHGWMTLQTNIEIFLGKNKIDDVYIGDNGMLAQEFKLSKLDSTRELTIKAINNLDKTYKNISTHMLLIPNKIGLYEETFKTYPDIMQFDSYSKIMKQLNSNIYTINTWDILNKHKNEDVFFKTDHHWTGLGAKYVAEEFLKKSLKDYQPFLANDSFYGSLSKKIAYQKESDQLYIYKKKKDDSYIVEYPGVKDPSVSLYDQDKIQSSDPYATYFGGNYPIVKITSANRQKKNLVIFKDSFANAFVPYLLPYYHKIIMIDPRYYYDDIHMLLKDENIHEILYLMNMNTFFSDSSLLQVLS